MEIRELYHGTNGDNILQIVRFGLLKPNADGKIFFSRWRFDSVLMHGPDSKRMASFAVKLRVTIPSTASVEYQPTDGVPDTVVLLTTMPVHVQVIELYIRAARASTVNTIRGIADITKYLQR
jgi:hypothetical protein